MANRYEMLWDCPSCGTRKLLGLTHRHCPNCGAAQDSSRRYFPREGEEVAVEGHTYVGADLACPACSSPNSAAAHNCVNCGSGLEGATAVVLRKDQTKSATDGFAEDSATIALAERSNPEPVARPKRLWGSDSATNTSAADDPAALPSSASDPPKKRRWPMVVAGLIMAALVAAFWTRAVTATVKEHSWLRAIDIERLTPTTGSDWRGQVPGGAYAVSCHSEVREHRQVADGQDCSNVRKDAGDGTFTTERQCSTRYRSEPVYDDKCSYTVDLWTVVRTEQTKGVSLKDGPRWPPVTLVRPGSCVGCDREGGRREDYVITFAYEGKTDRCSFPQARWQLMRLNEELKAKARVLTGGLACSSIN